MRTGALGWLFRLIFGTYSLTLLFLLMSVAALLALLLPSLHWRRSTTRWLHASGSPSPACDCGWTAWSTCPQGSCVLVANHSSYLDGVVMKAGPAAALQLRDQA